MSSPSEINRANAQHSTGPTTQAGKKASSLNALRHGLTAQIVVLPGEDHAAYQRHVKSFNDEYNPKGATESHLVRALADTAWRLNRVAALETNVLTLAADPLTLNDPDPLVLAAICESQAKAIASLSMHSQRLSRQFERTVAQLRDLQKTRHDQEKDQLSDLLDIIEMHKAEGHPYNPSADGFVFSDVQIQAARQSRTRKTLAFNAYPYRNAAA
jgi:hypothetical protein